MRLGLGLAYASVWGSGPFGNASITGTGIALSAAFGGTVARGVVIGGGLELADGVGKFTGSPLDAGGHATVTMGQALDVLVDWFPNPLDGWHVGTQIGLGDLTVTDSAGQDSSGGVALVGSILGGYDWWIGPQWSLGLQATLSTTTRQKMHDSNNNDTGYFFTPLSFALEATILWH